MVTGKGSGISLYYKHSIQFTRIDKLDIRNDYFESMGGCFKSALGNVNIIIIYRFKKNPDDKFYDLLTNILEDYSNSPTFIVGDFNFNCFKYCTNSHVARYCESSGFPHLSVNNSHRCSF